MFNGHFFKTQRVFLNLICLNWGFFVDKIFKIGQPSNLSYKDSLAQPLKLKESLKIRDGLGRHDTHSIQWPQVNAKRLAVPDLGYFWASRN